MNLVKTHQGRIKKVSKETVVLRRMRIFRRITRPDAAKALGVSAKLIEKFENGRCGLTLERMKALLRRYRFTWDQFIEFQDDISKLPEASARSIYKSRASSRLEGRKYQKQISKGARVLKILRNMRGWSQPVAASKCGWSRSCIDHLENGRVELTEEKIAIVLRSYEYNRHIYEELLEAPMLRDEVVSDSLNILTKLENDKLKAVKALLDNFR